MGLVTLDEITKLIGGDRYGKQYKIRLTNGKTIIRQMWSTESGHPVLVKHGCRVHGYLLVPSDYANWESISLYDPDKAVTLSLYERRIKKVISLLQASGFRSSLKEELEFFLSLPLKTRTMLLNDIQEDSYEKFYVECRIGGKYHYVHTTQVFITLSRKDCWTYPRFNRMYNKSAIVQLFNNAKARNEKFSARWRNGYDIYYDLDFTGDEKQGWYTEETTFGKEHFYLLLDATHAIYLEDD